MCFIYPAAKMIVLDTATKLSYTSRHLKSNLHPDIRLKKVKIINSPLINSGRLTGCLTKALTLDETSKTRNPYDCAAVGHILTRLGHRGLRGLRTVEDVTGLQLVHTGNVQVVIAVSCKGFGGDVKEGVWLGGGGLGSSVQLQHAVVVQVLQHAGRA